MAKNRLNDNEREILEVLWREGKPMIISEIAEIIDVISNTVHVNIKKLIKKGLVEQAGVGKRNHQPAYNYQPTLSREQFLANETNKYKDFYLPDFVAGLLGNAKVDESTLTNLEKIIAEKKKELRDKQNLE